MYTSFRSFWYSNYCIIRSEEIGCRNITILLVLLIGNIFCFDSQVDFPYSVWK